MCAPNKPQAFHGGLLGALLLLDPVMVPPHQYSATTAVRPPRAVARRRDAFANAVELRARLAGRPPFASFHPQVLTDYCTHGLRPADAAALVSGPDGAMARWRCTGVVARTVRAGYGGGGGAAGGNDAATRCEGGEGGDRNRDGGGDEGGGGGGRVESAEVQGDDGAVAAVAASEGMVLACPPAVEAAFYAGAYEHCLHPQLRRVTVPVRVLRAARRPRTAGPLVGGGAAGGTGVEAETNALPDFAASPTDPRLWCRFGGEASDVVMPESTHFFPMEHPARTARAVMRFWLDVAVAAKFTTAGARAKL
jgi:pimeloyl-ACP methyl ester carboxylesterase